MTRLFYRLGKSAFWTLLVAFAMNTIAATIDLQGVNKGSTNYFGGPLNGWNELDFIQCRVVINSSGSNQVVVNFNNNANGKPGIQNLFYFTPSANVGISTPILTASNTLQDWYYTFSVNVTNPPGYVYYQARMAAGAHLFGGASLHMFNPQLQLAKPVPAAGSPDLVIIKSGPATIGPGQILTYSIIFSNKLTAANASIGNEIYDTIPNGATYANVWSGSPGVQFFQSLGNQLWWDLPDLQPGQSGTLTYQLIVGTNVANGTILQNNAQILSTQNDANMADNASTVSTRVVAALPPNATADTYNVSQNQTLTMPAPGVLGNDSDPLGATLKAVLVTNVTSGTLTLNTNGSFTFVPVTNFSGTVYFYYVASNATLASSPTKVTINVSQFASPADVNVSCAAAVPTAATNLSQFLAQGGIDGGPYCGQPTVVTLLGDSSNGGAGCPASPLVITRTYKLTTGCGDVTNLVQKITVIDTTAPIISAMPADATYFCPSQMPPPNDGMVSASDNCTGGVTISHQSDIVLSSNCVNQFTIQRTYVATDSCGNSSSKAQLITVDGTQPPTITSFPANATFSCASDVPPVDESLVGATNACGGSAGVMVSHFADTMTSSNCPNRFVVQRTYFVTDACGNATSKTQTITVNGTAVPVITTFPTDATYPCADAVPAADDGSVTATNACGGNVGVVITHLGDSVGSSNCVNRFTISRTYIATDACGNSSSKTQNITVNALAAPTIVAFPADVTVSCPSGVPVADDALVTATNACGGGVSIAHLPDVVISSNCPNRFSLQRTYVATDSCGNSASKFQVISVDSTTAPTIATFPADVTVSCADSVPAPNDSAITATDNCGGSGGVAITHDPDVISSSNCVNRFTVTRTYHATDACGNATSKAQTITVNATTAPTITGFPADATYACAGAVPAADDSLVAATDSCAGKSSITITHDADVITSSNCVNRFTIMRTYHATDSCGNASSRSQTITVTATIAPVIATFPQDATYSCASDVPSANDTLVTAVDNCSGNSSAVVTHNPDLVTAGVCSDRFTIARTYVATDACGNSSSKTQTITVHQATPPTITGFPVDATYSCANGVPAANDTLVSAIDGCSGSNGLTITHQADVVASSNCVSRFTISRTYVATDACGNAASRTQIITINGTTGPTISGFPQDATYLCAGDVPAANDALVAATDNCGASGVTISHDVDVIGSSNCVSRFVITRTYRATDACGNVTSKSQTITVNATNAPTITSFPADATYSCAGDVPGANDSLVSCVDGCGGTGLVVTHLADVVTSGACANRYAISRTYIATDTCGNSSSKTQIITINNTTPPTITSFPVDATYPCVSAIPPANDSLVTSTDNCGSSSTVTINHDADVVVSSNCANRLVITRTYRATDSCGNVTIKSQTLTVNATTAPTIVDFPADATYGCAQSVPAADDSLVTAIDGCGGSSGFRITHNQDLVVSSNCVNRFTINRTYVATDTCGNSSSKTQTITVNGTIPPTITGFPADATYSCAESIPAANDALVAATNACGGTAGVVISHSADVVTSSNCVNRFTVSRTYIATDACGNSSSKSQTITVNGTIPPTITAFPADATYSCATAMPVANDSLVSAANACGGSSGVVVTHIPDVVTSSNCVNRFTVARTYAVTDACGNSTSKTQVITVNGVTAPTITTFPADATYACSASLPAANDSLVSGVDNCGGTALLIAHDPDTITSSNCVNHYTITRTYRATDACGNTTTKSQTIVINDNQAPTISCPAPVTVSLPTLIPTPDATLVTASDNCSNPQKSFVADLFSTNGYVVTINRTYAATDDCGNRSTCSQTIIFNPLLAKPTANADSYSVLENKVLNVSAPGVLANDTDPNNLPLQAILVTGPTNGALTLNSNGTFQYTPNTNYFGADSFTYKASNTGTLSDPVTVTIDVVFVNQQPSFTKGPDISVLEDSTTSTTPNWATNIKPGPTNESNQVLNFIISNDNTNLFTAPPTLSTNGTLTFTPKPLTIGSATVTVALHDNGGTANGGIDTSVAQTFVITVIAVNHPPSFTKGPDQLVHNYAGAQTRLDWAGNISPGPANETWQALNFIVSNNKNSIFAAQPAINTNGTLTFSPATNKYGIATVSVSLHDNGGTANGGQDTSATQTFTITVNNPPIVDVISPTNNSLFLYPSPVALTANAYDLDGIVTNVLFFNGTNLIGQGTTQGDNLFSFNWTNAPATNSVVYALATDNNGATNLSSPINIQLGNPVTVSGGPVVFSPSLFSWGQKLTVANPTISTVQSVTVTFTSVSSGTSIQGVTGTNSVGQPFITFNNTIGPVTVASNYATILYVATSQPVVTFITSASLTPGPTFTVNSTNLVKLTRFQFQTDGSTLVNFVSSTNKTYYVQYSSDCKTWFTSPLPLKGNGTQLQWVDFGPGVTQSLPRNTSARFYRVVAP